MTQTERVLQYIRDTGSITQADACRDLGCYRLSARIYDLRRLGYPIQSVIACTKNRYGETVTFKRYMLGPETQ